MLAGPPSCARARTRCLDTSLCDHATGLTERIFRRDRAFRQSNKGKGK
jgi:hypothetical protein